MEQIEVIIQDANEQVKSVMISDRNADGIATTIADVCANDTVRYLFGCDDDTDLAESLDVPDGWRNRILGSAIKAGDDPIAFDLEFAVVDDIVTAGDTTAARGTAGVVTVMFNGGLTHTSVNIINGVTTLYEVLSDGEVANIGVDQQTLDVAIISVNTEAVPRNLYGAQIMHSGDEINISTNKTHNKA